MLLKKDNIKYSSGTQFSLGGFYLPNFSSLTSYWKRIVYRFGYRRENTGLVFNSFPLKETAFSFGVGLPMAGFSNTNIGFEVGGYPAGQMYGVRFEHYWGKLHNRELNLRVGYNRAFRYNWSGLNDDEQGGGFGFSVGYRHHFQRKGRYNLFAD